MRRILSFYILLYLASAYGLRAQTGPGGIERPDGQSHLVLWLEANQITGTDGQTVRIWPDRSGYGHDFKEGNGAIFHRAYQNGQAVLQFYSGSKHYFQRPYTEKLSPRTFTVLAVDNVDAVRGWKAVISDRDEQPVRKQGGYILYSASRRPYNWEFWTGDSTGSGGRWGWGILRTNINTTGQWASQTMEYQPVSRGKKIYINGKLAKTTTHPYTPNKIQPFRIGAGRNERTNPDYFYSGYIGEIIIFDRVLTDAERIIVQNYLAAKYGYALWDNDFYTQDDDSQGNFDFHVAGIGQDISGNAHTASQGTGIVLIDNPSDLDNDEYLFWGENVNDATYEMVAIDDETYRLNTLWRVSKRNDLGTVDVHFDENAFSFDPSLLRCASLKLVVSNSEDFAVKRSYPLVNNNGVYTATDVLFNDGDYFNIEYSVDRTVWDGAQWSAGAPGVSRKAVLAAAYDTDTHGDLTACACQVEAGQTLHITDGHFADIRYDITNNGSIIVENQGALVQRDNQSVIDGSGLFRMNKTTRPLNHYYDYVYWSSPFDAGALTLGDVVPDAWAYYVFYADQQDPTQYPDPGWIRQQANDPWPFAGEGVAISAPRNFNGGSLNVTFNSRQPFNNAWLPVPIIVNGQGAEGDDDWNLIGNPYPSAIDFDALAQDNPAIQGAYYAWTNCAGLDNQGHHQESGYATYAVGTGGTAACGGTAPQVPDGYIASGQAVMVEGNQNGLLMFKNDYRVTGHNDGFINRQEPLDRIWINLSEADGSFRNQILLGFVRGATDGRDRLFDARNMSGGAAYLYTLIGDDKMNIQGLAPLTGDERRIPAGVYADGIRTLQLSISRTEGLLDSLPVYVIDHRMGITHDLKQGPYTFQTVEGDDPGRFTFVVGGKPLDVEQTVDLSLQIRRYNNGLTIRADRPLQKIELFDLQGRFIAAHDHLHKQQIYIPVSVHSTEILLVRILTGDNHLIIRKVIWSAP